MERKGTSVFENGLIWFGAAVSIAEILTGALFAPLGFSTGLAAILLGHLIGCALLFLAGLIGGQTRRSAMQTAGMAFGRRGALLFTFLNIVQLAGWTAIMIYDGSLAANEILGLGNNFWCGVIGMLILVWILVGIRNLGKINAAAMAALFLLTVVLSFVIFKGGAAPASGGGLSFGAAVELSVAMPLSWLPLISDYTREAEKPLPATLASALVYGAVSCWMYVIGMGAAIFTGESDVAKIMVGAGLGAAGLLIIVFSTVPTTFLDAWSAGVSGETLSRRVKGKPLAAAVAILGAMGAMTLPLGDITDFLYLIGSVFAPMVAVQIADWFLLEKDRAEEDFCFSNLAVWFAGFLLYRWLMGVDTPVGSTLPDMVLTLLLCLLADRLGKIFRREKA